MSGDDEPDPFTKWRLEEADLAEWRAREGLPRYRPGRPPRPVATGDLASGLHPVKPQTEADPFPYIEAMKDHWVARRDDGTQAGPDLASPLAERFPFVNGTEAHWITGPDGLRRLSTD